jgi:hypothetical protein
LKDHGDIAPARVELVDGLVPDRDLARGDLLESGHHPESRRLAAAGGADEDHELARRDVEREVFDRRDVVVDLRHAVEGDGRGDAGGRAHEGRVCTG